MAAIEQDLDLQILKEAGAPVRYRVNVIQSPAGEADGEFELPYAESELNDLFRGLGHVRRATRGAASPEVARAREFGTQLFDRVFSGDVRDCLNNSRGRTQAAGQGLRIRLRLTKVPELLDLPWELMFDRRYNRFVALDDGTTVVRHLPVAEPVVPMRVNAPLRVLVAISNPRGDLDTGQEWVKLTSAFAGVIERGQVEVERLQPATFDGLDARLHAATFHVLHFVGHGGYDAATQSGFLCFETERKGEKRVGAARLADLLRPHRSLRLVVLNACEGGRTSRDDAFAGVAQSLVQSAIPAVVAMQFPVTDKAAIEFAAAFYAGLASGRPVDLALADARRNVNLKGEEGDIEWATPVLYMRGGGALFDIGAGVRVEPGVRPLPSPTTAVASREQQAAPTAGASLAGPKAAAVMLAQKSTVDSLESSPQPLRATMGQARSSRFGPRVKGAIIGVASAAVLLGLLSWVQPTGLVPPVTAIFFASVEGAIAGAIVGASRPRLIGACIGALVGAIVMFGIELGVFRASSFSEDAFIFVYSTVGRPWLMAIAGAGLGALFERRRANSQRPP
jgi:hypothetical protein